MTSQQISRWLKKNKSHFAIISIESGISVPTLYSLADKPSKKRQKRIVDAITTYITSQEGK